MSARLRLIRVPSLSWLLLYAITLAVSVISVIARAWMFALVAYPVCWILGWPTGWVSSAAVWVAVAPLAWSALALVWTWPWLARQQTGARPPSDRERAILLGALDDLIAMTDMRVPIPASISVLDDSQLNASVIGREVFVNRGLLTSPHLRPVLAHELGHLAAGDGVQTVALSRLAFFPTLLCGRPAGDGLINRALRALTYAASGELALRVVTPIWAAYWRDQEYQADQFAAHLGQGPALAWFLEEHALLYDLPVPFVWMTDLTHPFTEERINRLLTDDGEPAYLETTGLDEAVPMENDAYDEPILPRIGES